jgi:hypothetical protein
VFQKELFNSIPTITAWRVLRKRLHLKAYKLSIVQGIGITLASVRLYEDFNEIFSQEPSTKIQIEFSVSLQSGCYCIPRAVKQQVQSHPTSNRAPGAVGVTGSSNHKVAEQLPPALSPHFRDKFLALSVPLHSFVPINLNEFTS